MTYFVQSKQSNAMQCNVEIKVACDLVLPDIRTFLCIFAFVADGNVELELYVACAVLLLLCMSLYGTGSRRLWWCHFIRACCGGIAWLLLYVALSLFVMWRGITLRSTMNVLLDE